MILLWALLGIAIVAACLTLAVFIQLIIYKAPFVKTPAVVSEEICSVLRITDKDIVVDLGCGDASILIGIENLTHATCIGYDVSPIAFIKARWNIYKNKSRVRIQLTNFFSADISQATIIYCFLIPSLMDRMSYFIRKRAKLGTRIASYGYRLPGLRQIGERKIAGAPSTLYIYSL